LPWRVTLDKEFKVPGFTNDKVNPVQFSIKLPRLSAVKILKVVIGLNVGGFLKLLRVISIIFPVGRFPEFPFSALVIVTVSVVVPNDETHVGLTEVICKLERHPVS
jgi:hypothetical protein